MARKRDAKKLEMLRKFGFGNHRPSADVEDEDGDSSTEAPRTERPDPVHFASAPAAIPSPSHTVVARPTARSADSIPATATSQNSSMSGASSIGRIDSSFSSMTLALPPCERGPSANTLGLHLMNRISNPVADVILVHGLGGAFLSTWSWKGNTRNFWPTWLSSEQGLANLRVFSFGYNANFRGPHTTLGILDFAKDLLFKMSGWYEENEDKIGKESLPCAPIIFAAHSMGGLVVKKAYLLGIMDDAYADMISRTLGIVFLSTPHKGSAFASVLNSLLAASLISSAKVYVAELDGLSPTIQDLNEQFRLQSGKLRLFSFYETLKTTVGPGPKKLVVDKNSGVLGYPQEVSSYMTADHHNVCKYSGPDDPNFISLKNVLRSWTSPLLATGSTSNPDPSRPGDALPIARLAKILGVQADYEDDLRNYREAEGTCTWLQERQAFQDWTQPSGDSAKILWLTGLPGTGKSTLAQFTVQHMESFARGLPSLCQYYFFAFADSTKKSVEYALRSIAFQLSLVHEPFRTQLLKFHEETGISFFQQKLNTVWSKIFEGIIFKMDFRTRLCWVIDGLDEAACPATLVNLLFQARSVSPLKIFLTSRPTRDLMPLATSRRSFLKHEEMTTERTAHDIEVFVRNGVRDILPWHGEMLDHIMTQILAKASGSFLWVKLALKTLEQNWHTEEDIKRALNEVPQGMELMYERMIKSVESLHANSPRNYELARRILINAACSARPLTTLEMGAALQPEFSGFINLEGTILQLCGHFLLTRNSRISLIHETANSFLFSRNGEEPAFLDRQQCHTHLGQVCITYMSSERWKDVVLRIQNALSSQKLVANNSAVLAILKEEPLLDYAISYWAFHVSHADVKSSELLSTMQTFFDHYALSWVHATVLLKGLRVVTRSAQFLKTYVRRRGDRLSSSSPISIARETSQNIQLWAVDFIRLIGKFGSLLRESPLAIYKFIPPLCPRGSMVFRMYSAGAAIQVVGISSEGWDDGLARLNLGGDRSLSKIVCTGTHFVCLISATGTIIVCLADSCEESRRMSHGEWVSCFAVNKSGSMIVTAGLKTLRVWELSSGEELFRIPRNTKSQVMEISFGILDTELLVSYDDCRVVWYNVETGDEIQSFLFEEPDDHYHSCPRVVAFGPNVSKVALAFRGRPVLVWDLTVSSTAQRPYKCIRAADRDILPSSAGAWDLLDSVIWHPSGTSLFVLYQDTTLVWYSLTDDEFVEHFGTLAREMTISHDGNLLLTSDNAGTTSVWSIPKLHLVYRLPHEEMVRGFTFSPDSQRFYDIRGAMCNVWEPDVLIRAVELERDEDVSSCEASDRSASETTFSPDNTSRSQITGLAHGPTKDYFICGRDDGSVIICETATGKKIRKVYGHSASMAVIAVVWSPRGKYVVSCDESGKIICKRLETQAVQGKWKVFPCFEIRVEHPARQFLFHTSESHVLIASPASECVWNLKTKTQTWQRDRPCHLGVRWINHPTRPDLILCIQPHETSLHSWHPDSEQPPGQSSRRKSQPSDSTGATEDSSLLEPSVSSQEDVYFLDRVRRADMTENRVFIVSEILPSIGNNTSFASKHLRLEVILSEDLHMRATQPIQRTTLEAISCSVVQFLGCYRNRIVFFDHQYWVCSSDIGKNSRPKRHFFVPQDWIDRSTLPLITLLEGGTLLFPRNGEIAVVSSGLV